MDLRVEAAWLQGIDGRGVVTTIIDDGVEKSHPDLKDNYVRSFIACDHLSCALNNFKVDDRVLPVISLHHFSLFSSLSLCHSLI